MTDMYALVSWPGPVETAILEELSPAFAVRRRPILNMTLRCLEAKAPERQGADKAPVVFLHGRGSAASIWFPFLPEIARRRRVLAVDLPGFGHSSSPPFASRDPELGLRFFVDPIEALLVELGVPNATVIGHSLGGFIAIELSLRRVVRPSQLVLIGGMGLGPEMTYASRAFFRLGPEPIARVGGKGLMKLLNPPPKTPLGERVASLEQELYTVRGGRPAPSAAFNTLFPAAGPVFHRRDRLAEIEAETWILWGKNDAVFPPSVAVEAGKVMRDAKVQIEPFGHAPHLEAPERTLAQLLDFLGE